MTKFITGRAVGTVMGKVLSSVHVQNIMDVVTNQKMPREYPASSIIHINERIQEAWYENTRSHEIDDFFSSLATIDYHALFSLFHAILAKEPILCGEFLASLRRYRVLYGQEKTPISDSRGTRKSKRKNDNLLQAIHKLIVLFDNELNQLKNSSTKDLSEITTAKLLFRYERAMIEKFDGELHVALKLIEQLEREIEKLESREDRQLQQAFFNKCHHQLFTFEDPKRYNNFQKSLIHSRLGGKSFAGKELIPVIEDLCGLRSTIFDVSSKLKLASRVRYVHHMETMLKRDFGPNYIKEIESKDLHSELLGLYDDLLNQATNGMLQELQRPKLLAMIRGEEHVEGTSEHKKKTYDARLSNIIHQAQTDEFSIENKKKISMKLELLGDLSRQSPYNQNSGLMTNLNMFQGAHVDSNLQFDATMKRDGFTKLIMSRGLPGGINYANAILDAVYVNSLRVEKIQTLRTPKDLLGNPSSIDFLAHAIKKSTGHIEDLSTKIRCNYAMEDQELLNALDNEARETIDLLNTFYNAYYPMTFLAREKSGKLVLDKKKGTTLTKTMNINRMNAIGKSLSTLRNALEVYSDGKSDDQGGTLAEKYNLMILPYDWKSDANIFNTISYQLLFVVMRLEELIESLNHLKTMYLRAVIPQAFRNKIAPLLAKFSYLLGLELAFTYIVHKQVYDVCDQKIVKHWLESYGTEVKNKKQSLPRHPIFRRLEKEVLRAKDSLSKDDFIERKIVQMYAICSNFSGGLMEKRLTKSFSIKNLNELRTKFADLLTGKAGNPGDFSGEKILTSNLLSSRLIQVYIDSTEQDLIE